MSIYRCLADKIISRYEFQWRENERMKETCICCVEMVVSNFLNVFFVILMAVIFKVLGQAVTFMITFGVLRFFAGGAHAKNYNRCILSYLGILSLSILLAKYIAGLQIAFSVFFPLLSILIAGSINYKYAARQWWNKERERKFRKILIFVFFAFSFCLFFMMRLSQYLKTMEMRGKLQEIILIQSFAILTASITLWVGRSECRKKEDTCSFNREQSV